MGIANFISLSSSRTVPQTSPTSNYIPVPCLKYFHPNLFSLYICPLVTEGRDSGRIVKLNRGEGEGRKELNENWEKGKRRREGSKVELGGVKESKLK